MNTAEGIGFKPALGWLDYGGLWCGAAGAQFDSSPKQLRAALEFHNITQVILNPDGGAIQNPDVMRRYRGLYTLLDGWGYSLKVRWWGQTEKGSDVDEISPDTFHNAKLLSWEEFERFSPHREISDVERARIRARERRERARDTKALKRRQTMQRALAILTQALPTAHRETRGGYLPRMQAWVPGKPQPSGGTLWNRLGMRAGLPPSYSPETP